MQRAPLHATAQALLIGNSIALVRGTYKRPGGDGRRKGKAGGGAETRPLRDCSLVLERAALLERERVSSPPHAMEKMQLAEDLNVRHPSS